MWSNKNKNHFEIQLINISGSEEFKLGTFVCTLLTFLEAEFISSMWDDSISPQTLQIDMEHLEFEESEIRMTHIECFKKILWHLIAKCPT